MLALLPWVDSTQKSWRRAQLVETGRFASVCWAVAGLNPDCLHRCRGSPPWVGGWDPRICPELWLVLLLDLSGVNGWIGRLGWRPTAPYHWTHEFDGIAAAGFWTHPFAPLACHALFPRSLPPWLADFPPALRVQELETLGFMGFGEVVPPV